jgi:GT2 family glycosyltransferase
MTRRLHTAPTPSGNALHSKSERGRDDVPYVSFVVIAFNEAANIAACLQSLSAQDAVCRAEFIVVDDASTDRTREITDACVQEDDRLRVISFAVNQGRGAARAAGVDEARGDYVAFVDADIVLPANWLSAGLACLATGVDGCGGIAVPDGDVAYLFNRFRLRARPIPPAATVTGNNGLFRRSVFEQVAFSTHKRNGEDVDFVHRMEQAGLRLQTLAELVVDHRESKGFRRSVGWLFESGIGASVQFREQRRVRTPDLAVLGLLASIAAAPLLAHSTRMRGTRAAALPVAYVALTAGVHLWSRFEVLASPLRSVAAWLCNIILITSYFTGRLRGLLVPLRRPQRRWRRP